MGPELLGFIGIIVLFGLLALGMWVGTAAAFVGIIGLIAVLGPQQAFTIIGSGPYSQITNYNMITIPMFILMAMFIAETRLGSDLYDSAHKWIGQLRGGLAGATIAACGLMGAVTGGSVPSIAVMSKVAKPQMQKYGYAESLIAGSIASGSTASIMIPPSFVFVLYGLLTEQSIGQLFVAGILPGVLQVFLYLCLVYVLCRVYPQMGPPGPKYSIKEKLQSLKDITPILLLFLLVIGGIYAGKFTPNEAGAVGSVGALIIVLFKRLISGKGIVKSIVEAGLLASMILFMIVGIYLFQMFLTVSKVPFMIGEFVVGLDVPRFLIMLVIMLIYLLLGCVLPEGAIVLLTIPILYPLIVQLGFDTIWFGVILVKLIGIGQVTPPVGMNCFILSGMSGIPLNIIFKGIVPFLIADVVHLALLFAFPIISLFLINLG
jgi:tripartite ATP-independent transporter DctM subunit